MDHTDPLVTLLGTWVSQSCSDSTTRELNWPLVGNTVQRPCTAPATWDPGSPLLSQSQLPMNMLLCAALLEPT